MRKTPLTKLIQGVYPQEDLDTSLEMIGQQKLDFFNDLTAIYKAHNGDSRRDIVTGSLGEDLATIVKKYMNLYVKVELGNERNNRDDVPFHVVIGHPSGSKFHMSRKEAEALNKKFLTFEFDTRTPYIKGDTKDLPLTLGVDTSIVSKGRFSSEELAAITLHELGHLWTILFMATRVSFMNIALQEIARFMDADKDPIKRKASFELLSRDLSMEELSKLNSKIDFTSDTNVIVTFVTAEMAPVIFSELGSPEYGVTMEEYAADAFATRFGAGKYLITALDRMNKGYPEYVSGVRVGANVRFIISILMTLVTGGMALTGVAAMVWPAIVSLVSVFLSVVMVLPGSVEYLYDRTLDRFKRIRNQIQLRMREYSDSQAAVKLFKEDLEAVDQIIARTTDKDSYFTGYLVNVFSPSVRRRNRQAELEIYFEDLAYNRLYDASMNFKFL